MAVIIFVIACAIISGLHGGIGLFFGLLIIGFWPALMLYAWWVSLKERSGARLLLLLGIVAAFIFVVGRQEDAATRETARRREAAKAVQQYQAWYNSLPPYQRLQVDNARLEEENARLRDQTPRDR